MPIERHYAYWQCDRLAQRDPQTSRSHNETGQEHWGLWRKARDGLVMGGATGICQSSCSPQRMSWTLLSPSLCEGWQLQTQDNVCSSAAACLAGRMNYHTAETGNTAQPCSTDEKQTLIKPVCTYSVCWWSVSSSWQITSQIRYKEVLTHGFCFARVLPGNLLWTLYCCSSTIEVQRQHFASLTEAYYWAAQPALEGCTY